MANGLDLTSTILAIVGGSIVAFISTLFARHLTKSDKTADESKTAILTTSMVQEKLEDSRKQTCRRLEEVAAHADRRFEDLNTKIDKMLDKLNTHDTDIKLHELRLKYLDKRSNWEMKKNGEDNNL